eukprot:m.128175 g.128175  ORF g.128175 m.128175 type:complete len:52 (+) comp13866_c1_seq3:2419-2574(+)
MTKKTQNPANVCASTCGGHKAATGHQYDLSNARNLKATLQVKPWHLEDSNS